MSQFIIRDATENDIPFLVDVIIEAEKSGTDKLSYCTIFGLSEDDTRKYIADMLLEEIDDCELSVSSFLLAEKDNVIIAGVGAWIEGFEGVSSNILKRNLLNYTLPKTCFENAIQASQIVRNLYIEEKVNTIQIGMVYVSPLYRGNNLSNLLIEEQINRFLKIKPNITELEVQVFGNNVPAINAYKKAKFKIVRESFSDLEDALLYFPDKKKILMNRIINE